MTASALLQALATTPEQLRAQVLQPIEVVVFDSGIDATHSDLLGRIAAAVRVEIVEGLPRIVESTTPANEDVFGHGTAVASLIAAIAPNARIIDVRVLGNESQGSGDALLAGFEFGVRRQSRILNMSLAATSKFAAPLGALCETAYRQGQIVVAARRNMPLADNGFPAEFASSISVERAKVESLYRVVYRLDTRVEFSAHGEDVVVAAPGGGYTRKTGTSFATPIVSGLCALILGAFPSLRPFEVKTVLKAYADNASQ